MKVEIDTKLCKAYANCTFEAPEIFDDGSLENRRDEVERAVDGCPVGAIRITE